jgi:HAD superfamily hydrolase (TIGR01484 family)
MKASEQATLVAQLAAQRSRGAKPTAIFTDLDGTFVVQGNGAATQSAAELFHLTQARDYPIIAVTGRDTARLLSEIQNSELPRFNAVIGAVGTEILLQYDNAYKPDTMFQTQLRHRYNRRQVLARTSDLVRWMHEHHPDAHLELQAKAHAEPFKVSLHFTAESKSAFTSVAEPFKQAFSGLKVIVSEEIYHNQAYPGKQKKYNLDILPVSKSDAIRYLMNAYGITQGIVAGDSGNDVDALLVPGLVGVLVGGHKDEARESLQTHFPRAVPGKFHKKGSKHIFIDTDTKRAGAQSILHVLEHLHAQV